MSTVIRSLNNMLIIPVLEKDGTIGYKSTKNTILGHIAQLWGINIPAIIMEVQIDQETESWAERQHLLRGQLQDIEGEDLPEIFGMKISGHYMASLIIGTSKTRVLFLEERIHLATRSLFESPESMLAYGKLLSSEFTCYGAWELKGVNVQTRPDNFLPDMEFDGLGFCSADIFKSMKIDVLIQFRAVRSGLKQLGIAKGVLKYDASLNLPENTILLTKGTLKGAGRREDWEGKQDLWLGILRNYCKPSVVKDSWSWSEIPAHRHVKLAEIPVAQKKAHELMNIVNEPAKAMEYKGLIDREEGFSMLDQVLRVAVGATVGNRLPPLTQHPYIALGLRDLMASRLREIAVDGATMWNYCLNTATIMGSTEPRAIRTNLYPIGTELVVRRYPILLRDSWGVVVGKTSYDAEIQLSKQIQAETASDHDGDMIALIQCPLRLEIAKAERATPDSIVAKNHQRLRSTWWEMSQIIAKNIGSAGVGTATFGMLAAKIAGKDELANELAGELQKSVDSMKWSVRADINKCREAMELYGLPVQVAHRHDLKQFRTPETTDRFDDVHWNAIEEIYKQRLGEQKILPLSAFGSIFGHKAHGLSRDEYRSLLDIYRWYCSRVKAVSEMKDEDTKKEKMGELFELLRAWAQDKDDRWICAAWTICHTQTNATGNRAVFVFEVFRERLVMLLAMIYKAEEMRRIKPEDAAGLSKTQFQALHRGLRSKLINSGVPLMIAERASEETPTGSIKTVALVELKIAPQALQEALISKKASIVEDGSRLLPGHGINGWNVLLEGQKVGEVADKDAGNYSQMKHLKPEIITYRRSIKLVFAAK
ncbi:MAG: hypothetical protein HQL31_01305 [Planctomycetes bacterium]|nr:hypothetical protein [Planctomycetota bacterium]